MSDQERSASPTDWSAYYAATAARPARRLLLDALQRCGPAAGRPRLAVDLGCGAGNETVTLLEQGWHVLALDRESSALAQVRQRIAPEHLARLHTCQASFADADLVPCDLVWAGLSLPFCPPEQFQALWSRIVAALVAGGRFAGDFFGSRHAWRLHDGLSCHQRAELDALFAPFEVEIMTEMDGPRKTVRDGIQHYHGFEVVARKH